MQKINYQVGTDQFTGYLALPDTGTPAPGVLVVHEWWGLNEYIRHRAQQLAADGFAAFAIDLYGNGQVAAEPGQAEQLMNAALASGIAPRFDAAVAALSQQSSVDAQCLYAIGYCFGGAVVLNMARAGKALKAVASFHGLLQTEQPLQAGGFDGEIAVFTGDADPMVPPEVVAQFEAEMKHAGARYRLEVYPGVKHGFTNPAATERGKKYGLPLAYDQHADEDSYRQMLAVFRGMQ